MPGFQCDWATLWKNTDFDCEELVKLTYSGSASDEMDLGSPKPCWATIAYTTFEPEPLYQGKIQGIIRFSLYPYLTLDGMPRFIEILNIESISESEE